MRQINVNRMSEKPLCVRASEAFLQFLPQWPATGHKGRVPFLQESQENFSCGMAHACCHHHCLYRYHPWQWCTGWGGDSAGCSLPLWDLQLISRATLQHQCIVPKSVWWAKQMDTAWFCFLDNFHMKFDEEGQVQGRNESMGNVQDPPSGRWETHTRRALNWEESSTGMNRMDSLLPALRPCQGWEL